MSNLEQIPVRTSTVSWGMRDRFKFIACGRLKSWTPPALAGIYAVTYRQDGQNKPKAHSVVYFGESADMSKQPGITDETQFEGCVDSSSIEDLYVFIHPMPESSKFERAKVQDRLVSEYQPRANDV